MPYLSVGIITSKHSIAHPLQGLGYFQGRVIIVLSKHTPTEYQCLATLALSTAVFQLLLLQQHAMSLLLVWAAPFSVIRPVWRHVLKDGPNGDRKWKWMDHRKSQTVVLNCMGVKPELCFSSSIVYITCSCRRTLTSVWWNVTKNRLSPSEDENTGGQMHTRSRRWTVSNLGMNRQSFEMSSSYCTKYILLYRCS